MSISEIAREWRERTRARVLAVLKQKGPMTVRQLMAETNVSRGPLDSALVVLRKQDKVKMSIAERRGRGMAPCLYSHVAD